MAKANINCATRMMDISFEGEKVSLNVFKTSQYPNHEEECNVIDVIEELINKSLMVKEECLEEGSMLQDSLFSSAPYSRIEPLPPWQAEPILPSLDQPPILELKPLLDSLKYAYLGLDYTLPVIITPKLTSVQESQLLDVLKEHRGAIGWSVVNLKGISPDECMHCIYLEDNAKSSRDMQRWLNPNMKEVVKK